ncbi:MAG: GDP-mannose 4,6-dehydratase [Pseudomonadota bacterium]
MRALICGIGGQDGAYLARDLLSKGYEVIGTSRDAFTTRFDNLTSLGIFSNVKTVSMAAHDFRSVFSVIRAYAPDEIYNLSGQSSVGLSFEQPVDTIESIAIATLNLLEAIRFEGRTIRFYNAGSGECFGNTLGDAASETTPFKPRSPYAVAKVTAHNLVENYRESYGLFACTGILFNHESPLRPARFVTQKIVQAAARIARGSTESLSLGNLDVSRDWGWAPDYVDAMWRMLQQDEATDFVVATGRTESLHYFVQQVFAYFNLVWQEHAVSDAQLLRPADILLGKADPGKARTILGWQATKDIDGVIDSMCEHAARMERHRAS